MTHNTYTAVLDKLHAPGISVERAISAAKARAAARASAQLRTRYTAAAASVVIASAAGASMFFIFGNKPESVQTSPSVIETVFETESPTAIYTVNPDGSASESASVTPSAEPSQPETRAVSSTETAREVSSQSPTQKQDEADPSESPTHKQDETVTRAAEQTYAQPTESKREAETTAPTRSQATSPTASPTQADVPKPTSEPVTEPDSKPDTEPTSAPTPTEPISYPGEEITASIDASMLCDDGKVFCVLAETGLSKIDGPDAFTDDKLVYVDDKKSESNVRVYIENKQSVPKFKPFTIDPEEHLFPNPVPGTSLKPSTGVNTCYFYNSAGRILWTQPY
jgi:hypothetical protein